MSVPRLALASPLALLVACELIVPDTGLVTGGTGAGGAVSGSGVGGATGTGACSAPTIAKMSVAGNAENVTWGNCHQDCYLCKGDAGDGWNDCADYGYAVNGGGADTCAAARFVPGPGLPAHANICKATLTMFTNVPSPSEAGSVSVNVYAFKSADLPELYQLNGCPLQDVTEFLNWMIPASMQVGAHSFDVTQLVKASTWTGGQAALGLVLAPFPGSLAVEFGSFYYGDPPSLEVDYY